MVGFRVCFDTSSRAEKEGLPGDSVGSAKLIQAVKKPRRADGGKGEGRKLRTAARERLIVSNRKLVSKLHPGGARGGLGGDCRSWTAAAVARAP